MDGISWDNGRDIFKSIRFSCSQWFPLVARNFSQQSDIIHEGYGGYLDHLWMRKPPIQIGLVSKSYAVIQNRLLLIPSEQ